MLPVSIIEWILIRSSSYCTGSPCIEEIPGDYLRHNRWRLAAPVAGSPSQGAGSARNPNMVQHCRYQTTMQHPVYSSSHACRLPGTDKVTSAVAGRQLTVHHTALTLHLRSYTSLSFVVAFESSTQHLSSAFSLSEIVTSSYYMWMSVNIYSPCLCSW